MDNIYEKLTRVRKPRVHIQYEVETEDGVKQHELPFVIGVIGDFSSHPEKPLPPLKHRKFVSIDRDNFDQAMEKMDVGLTLKITDTLQKENQSLPIRLNFKSMRDFEPDRVIEQIEPLRRLKKSRDRLMALLNKSSHSEMLEEALEKILTDNKQLKSLTNELEKRGVK
jgi:type VI secretion system protein ImpB